ncbi:tetratricopeptide repeat protein [Ectothiorhodospiraceae bacterium BW-2]|nr:tetratricopeptide repeat protein [Ectothiorhodospiraceae bacterium BW-2]
MRNRYCSTLRIAFAGLMLYTGQLLASAASVPLTEQANQQLLNQHYQQAVQSYQSAIRQGEEPGRAFIGMAIAYLHLGQYPLARAALDEARERKPHHSEEIDKLMIWLNGREDKL